MFRPACCTLIALALSAVTARGASADSAKEVSEIFATICLQCHNSDKHKGDLRLDRPIAGKMAQSGKLIVDPKNPESSELIARIKARDDSHMPPEESGKKLTAGQIASLEAWVAQGAPAPAHWGFVAPVRPALPKVHNEKWVRNPIDRFVLARLEKEGLAPSPEADKLTLLRRLHIDLTGLAPTPAEIDAFLADTSGDAYEKEVDRLLASPHYGERWARHWLDAARYADSDGYEKDKPRQMSFYRDYVINAFNRDLPYDQFIIEQIAGDQLLRPTQDQIVATGFLRNSMTNEEAGADIEQFRVDALFDRMEAIGKGVLGLTIQCAQCHAHKYDPISQEEYFRMLAFLNNDDDAQQVVYQPAEQKAVDEIRLKVREIEQKLQRENPDWEARMARWEEEVARTPQTHWIVLPLENAGDNGTRFIARLDGSYLAQGYAATHYTASFRFKSLLLPITAFRLELLTDPNLPCGGPGRSSRGTCALTEFSVESAPAETPEMKTPVKFAGASSDFDQPERPLEAQFHDDAAPQRVTGPVRYAIDGDARTAWGIDAGPGRRNVDRQAVFVCETPIVAAKPPFPATPGTILTFSLKQDHGGPSEADLVNNNLGRFRLSATIDPSPGKADRIPARVRRILAIRKERRTLLQRAELFGYWRTTVPEWKEANEAIESLYRQWPEGSTAMTLMSRQDEPRETHVLQGGDWLARRALVTAGVSASLHPLPEEYEPSRLTLAKWLVDRKSPTTARVFVNRLWQAYFGTGIVATAEDFGTRSEPPSHPELLDWLACEFMDGGWGVKRMQRLIVTSATYRQSSDVTPDLYARDPNNRLLARGSRFRVEGEIVWDLALSASGLLNPKVGGRSVMPPAPAYLFKPPTSFAPFPWVNETGEDRYRRALYTFRRRSTPYPVLQAFDVPNGESACVRRLRSNSPLQALTSLNDPTFVDCARALARRTLVEGGATDDQRIDYAFRCVLTRGPSDVERAKLRAILEKDRTRLARGEVNADPMLGDAAKAESVPKQDWAAYMVISRILLNLDEAITRE